MASYSLTTRLPWQDRWTRPSVDQLLEPMSKQQRGYLQKLMDQLQGYEQVGSELIWYGEAWKWTIHYTVHRANRRSAEPETLCYLVPNCEQPIVCIPLADAMIEQLPMKRLGKFIREGIKSSKCAVAIHWAMWTPNAQTETDALCDLIKRKFNMQTAVEAEEESSVRSSKN